MSTGWDAGRYQSRHSYVFQYGESLIDLLAPGADERILDLGCGSGQLTSKIAERCAAVAGIDRSPEMIAEARRNFPKLAFTAGDAADFSVEAPVDAVFSNAVLHWVKDADGAARSVARALRPGGRFVFEMGGKGNTQSVLDAMRAVAGAIETPWLFPSIGEYASILERNGFEIAFAELFDRPTQVEGEDGLEDWLVMFGSSIPALTGEVRREVAALLRPKMFDGGAWTLDYRRLRMIAKLEGQGISRRE